VRDAPPRFFNPEFPWGEIGEYPSFLDFTCFEARWLLEGAVRRSEGGREAGLRSWGDGESGQESSDASALQDEPRS
jgi:hypothetical protein